MIDSSPQVHPTGIEHGFNKWERNCNTCRQFERTPHVKKGRSVAIKGFCLNPPSKPCISVYPQNWMGMTCWEGRV